MAADLLTRLHSVVPTVPFLRFEEVYPRSEAQARDDVTHERHIRGDLNRGRPGLERLGAARAAARALCATAGQTVLLHGDFLDKNLLRARHGYVAIDPLPQLGDPCADVGFFAAGHSWREDQQSLDELLDSDKFERLLRD